MLKILVLLLISVTAATGCSIHRLDIPQGNITKTEMVEQLEIGMNRKQVRFILGSPLINDPFRANRWDYVYFPNMREKPKAEKHLTLTFEDDILTEIIVH